MLALSVLSCTRGVRHTGNEARHVSSKRRAYSFERIIDDDLDSAVSSRFAAKLASKKKKAASSNNIPPHSRTSPSLKVWIGDTTCGPLYAPKLSETSSKQA